MSDNESVPADSYSETSDNSLVEKVLATIEKVG